MEVQDIIEENPSIKEMLKDCPYDVLKCWEVKEYPKGQIICHQNMYYEYFYIIVKGYANIYIMAENGKKYSQSIYKKGYFFGELEIFEQKPYICSVEALTDLQILRINREAFLAWIEKDKNFLLYITRTLCRSFYELSKKAGEDTLYSLKYRVCNYLIYCLDKGIKRENGIEVKIEKDHLSERFVVTQRSINRTLKYLKEQDIIRVNNKSILIIDVDKLKEEEIISRSE
ncbi:Crp/Fnr family transcriptional regulator [Natronincola ferrireducens]|uniref:cAMP-binding domain of CRP or a regulatory subunit of cAMP-dependent protein kinases n=1 Tax=Natronincola ferrireducens TaxID=393762 RepID=A0A1G9HC22_9FIRM|nr:Crp/Fnr family transcriptional regulator [Natronincola ferrireducens]SDL10571.1 cAMP-binding domain of CRP or a regulatory subunit of cAMP-dependent protein kinases [Natronincola ferrireducens]